MRMTGAAIGRAGRLPTCGSVDNSPVLGGVTGERSGRSGVGDRGWAMRCFDAEFPIRLGGKAGVATVRLTSRRQIDADLAGWSFCLAGPFALGLRIVEKPARTDARLRDRRPLEFMRGRDGVN